MVSGYCWHRFGSVFGGGPVRQAQRQLEQKKNTMKEVECAHQNRSESLPLEDQVQKKYHGVHQQQDVDRNQTAGKKKL